MTRSLFIVLVTTLVVAACTVHRQHTPMKWEKNLFYTKTIYTSDAGEKRQKQTCVYRQFDLEPTPVLSVPDHHTMSDEELEDTIIEHIVELRQYIDRQRKRLQAHYERYRQRCLE